MTNYIIVGALLIVGYIIFHQTMSLKFKKKAVQAYMFLSTYEASVEMGESATALEIANYAATYVLHRSQSSQLGLRVDMANQYLDNHFSGRAAPMIQKARSMGWDEDAKPFFK